jgi:hypothetical protein
MAAPKGNQFAAKSKMFERQLHAAFARDDYAALRRIAEKTIEIAETGESWAVTFIRDTLDGKPKQQTEITGEGGSPLRVILSEADAGL